MRRKAAEAGQQACLRLPFPLTSGPVSVILALQYGSDFASHAAIGNIAGLASIVAFALTYNFISRKQGWLLSASLAALAFLASTFVFNSFTLTLIPTFVIVVIAIGLFLKVVPHQDIAANTAGAPKWDLPARMIIATVFVVSLTAAASVLGPQLSGLITPFPVFGTVLSIFAHQHQGPDAAVQLLRGMGLSLFGVAGFFLIVTSGPASGDRENEGNRRLGWPMTPPAKHQRRQRVLSDFLGKRQVTGLEPAVGEQSRREVADDGVGVGRSRAPVVLHVRERRSWQERILERDLDPLRSRPRPAR